LSPCVLNREEFEKVSLSTITDPVIYILWCTHRMDRLEGIVPNRLHLRGFIRG
jgi:hypothetical protein